MNETNTMSEPYIVSARKYRPSTFATVVGQGALTSTLQNAIKSGRLAQAYLFCGPRGVGKTSCARIFAKTINCLHPNEDGEACGECESCRAIEQGSSFNIVELDAASNNSVEYIRALTDQVNVAPQVGRYRVFIIDEVHMLSSAAFNAFLKTLEEPPKYVIFILATTEKHKVIPTILSRCQIYDFKRITIGDMVSHLQRVAEAEGVEAEASALNVIARKADGAMRDALSIFDQVTASSRGHITYASAVESLNVLDYDYYFSLIDAFATHDVQRALMIYKEVRDKGFDSLFFINGLAGHVRDLMVAYTPQTVALLEVAPDVAERYMQQARSMPIEWYYSALELLNDCDLQYRTVTDKRLHVELCLIRLSRLGLSSSVTQSVSVTPSVGGEQSGAMKGVASSPRAQATSPGGGQAIPQQGISQGKGYAPGVRRSAGRVSSTVRISANSQGATSEASQTAESKSNEGEDVKSEPPAASDGSISLDALRAGWEEYMSAHPERHVLVSAMRGSELSVQGSEVEVLVPHVGSESALSASLMEITEYLRERSGDRSVRLHVRVSETQTRARRSTPREALVKAVRSNQVLHNLLDSLNVEMV